MPGDALTATESPLYKMITDAFDTSSLPPQAFVVLGAAFFAWIACLGLSLKLALKVLGANPGGYFSCLGYALMLPIVNGLIAAVALATIGHGYGLVGFVQLYVQIKILKVAGDCGGWKAFFAGIVHGIFATIFTLIIFLGVFFSGTIDPDAVQGPLQDMAKKAREQRSSAGVSSSGSSSGGGTFWGSARTTGGGATANPYFQD